MVVVVMVIANNTGNQMSDTEDGEDGDGKARKLYWSKVKVASSQKYNLQQFYSNLRYDPPDIQL